MKYALLTILLLTTAAYAQTDCPESKVCISREAAIKAIADADKVTALEAEGKAKDAAISDLKDLLNKSKVEFAAVSGENTALRQNDVSNRAIIKPCECNRYELREELSLADYFKQKKKK